MDAECEAAGKKAEQPARRRDAAATRAAILAAARVCFTKESYDSVGVRDIAAAAGVDPALVIRYFGSKEGLFAAAVLSNFGQADFLEGDRAQLGERLARLVMKKKAHNGFDPMVALVRSSLSPKTSGLIRDVMDEQVIEPLAERLGGEAAEARAALLVSHLLGLFIGRMMLQHEAFKRTDPETLIALLQPIFQCYIDGPDALLSAQPQAASAPVTSSDPDADCDLAPGVEDGDDSG